VAPAIEILPFNYFTGNHTMSDQNVYLEEPIIFVGPGRSGSTIISEFIMVHEQLAWPSNYLEMYPHADWSSFLRILFDNSFWRITAEKGQINKTRLFNTCLPCPAEAYPFWERLSRDEIDFSRGFLLGDVATTDEKKKIRAAFANLVKAQGRKRLALKTTGPGRIGYLQSIFPDAIFINVIRDPAATVRSLLNVPFWKDLGMHRLWWTGAYSETEKKYYQTIRHDAKLSTGFQLEKILCTTQLEAEQCKANVVTIHYEDFVANPSVSVKQILSISGLPSSKWINRKLETTPVQNRNRIQQSQFVR
jgi:hypothetical protein